MGKPKPIDAFFKKKKMLIQILKCLNKMEDKFLGNNLLVYIERGIAKSFDSDLILDDFISLRPRRMQF
jgi:hypothetical protein